jgi:hypothetical protein
MIKKYFFSIIYAPFVIGVLYTHGHSNLFSTNQNQPLGKMLIWLVFLAFSIYSIYCSLTEDFFKSLKKITAYKWGWQIGIDLWIGQFLLLFVIYWQTGSFLSASLWVIPCFVFGNLATLLYFAINYDALVALFFK